MVVVSLRYAGNTPTTFGGDLGAEKKILIVRVIKRALPL